MQGRTPLMLAAYMAFEASVSTLIKGGAELEARCLTERTPLLWALSSPHPRGVDCVQVMIERGCDIEATCPWKCDSKSGEMPVTNRGGYTNEIFVQNGGGELIARTIAERKQLSAEAELLAMLDAEEKLREDKKSQARKRKQKKKQKKNAKKIQQQGQPGSVCILKDAQSNVQDPNSLRDGDIATGDRAKEQAKKKAEKRRQQLERKAKADDPEASTSEKQKQEAEAVRVTEVNVQAQEAGEKAEAEAVHLAAKKEGALKKEQDEAWLREWMASLQTGSQELTAEPIMRVAGDSRVVGDFCKQLTSLGTLPDLRARLAPLGLDSVSSWHLHRSLRQLAYPAKVVTYTVAEMCAWDDDSEDNGGIVEAWLGTLDLAQTELEALVDVGLDGDDLTQATDETLAAHCKKTAKKRKEMCWPEMRARVLEARDAALGRSANAKRVGKLVIDKGERLGEATSSSFVFRGVYGSDEQECAVKMMLKADADARSEWSKEVETLLRVKGHRHLIEYIAREEDDACVYLAMELADGGTLAQRAAEALLGDWVQRKEMCRQLCEGLLTLHNECSVVHRDLKPQNVLFKSETTRARMDDMVLKIADFGLSRSISRTRSQRDTSSGGGTACWIPPEGLQNHSGSVELTFSYDVHPAGSLMYYILSGGEHAFHGRSEIDINTNIINQRHRRKFSAGRADNASEMEQTEALHLIAAMLRSNPAERPRGERAAQCMQAVLRHPFFMSPTQKLDHIDALHESRAAERWTVLEQRSSTEDWRSKLGKLVNLAGGGYRASLQEAARLLRNLRAHLLEKEDVALEECFGVEPRTVQRRDEVLVKLVGAKVPTLFLALLLM
jgi:serine/threonine protein kinase